MEEGTTSYTEQQERTAAIAKALSHPARIAILEYIIKNGGCCFTGINGCISLAKSTTSRHIGELVEAGLIVSDGNGTRPKYCINKITMAQARGLLAKVLDCGCGSTASATSPKDEIQSQQIIRYHC